MAVYKVTQEFPARSGRPEDRVVNTFSFETSEGDHTVAVAEALCGHVASAYNTTGPLGEEPVSVHLGHSVRLAGPPVNRAFSTAGGSPLAVTQWAGGQLPDVAGNSLPAQVACCLSFYGDLTGVPEEAPDDPDADSRIERPASRRRGRVFIGPLLTSTSVLGSSGYSEPTTAFINSLLNMGSQLEAMPAGLLTDVAATWGIRTNSGFAAGFNGVVRWHVDRRWDTQRRRLAVSSGRVVKNAP